MATSLGKPLDETIRLKFKPTTAESFGSKLLVSNAR